MPALPDNKLPRVCIIGAGSSGIAVAKAMKDRGIPFDCYEKGDQIGGNWYFRNTNGMSAAYESLHINTDCRLMEYRDYPMAEGTPDYPSHRVIMDYFNDYVDHFGLREHITFNTAVEHARRLHDGVWEVRRDDGEICYYDVLLVANGHHWDPQMPDPAYPGSFGGEHIHSHAYLTPEDPVDCRGKKVLVVGMGNSAMDIACELSRPGLADKVYLSARHGVWVVPKYIFGIPTTRLSGLPHWVPWRLNSWLTNLIVTMNVGKPWNYGLPKPDHRMLQAHPTISQEIYIRLGSGDILPRPGIERLDGGQVRFTDGRAEDVDVIIWCTGYKVSFPFFDPEFLSAPKNDLPLWERMVRPGIDNLFFIGLLQPLGAIMPMAEEQAKFIGDHLTGEVLLPSANRMQGDIDKERRAMFARYQDRALRHTMQVDFEAYFWRLERARRKGAKMADKAGNPPPVKPLAAAMDARAELQRAAS
jgi:cation diffusion facilitator CzcD-associated flavoprotein CzcO